MPCFTKETGGGGQQGREVSPACQALQEADYPQRGRAHQPAPPAGCAVLITA
jgi:hypothetical protein